VPIEQVVTVALLRSGSESLLRSGSESLPRSGAAVLWDALAAAGRELTGATRVVVLRGEGGDFVDDVTANGSCDEPDEPPRAATEWLSRPNVITIAAVSGRVTGAVLDAALACDLRIVADDAQLSASRSVGSIARLGELMGSSRALEFVVGDAAISGRQAVALGLANLSVPPDMLDAAVAEMVATVLRTPREVATVAKAALIESAAERRRKVSELVEGLGLAEAESL
jgi:enoyl-CoA hydratase/carnithine racemase